MNRQNYKILVWLVIALLILNISALGAILWFRYYTPPLPGKPYSIKKEQPGMRFHDSFIREEVGLDDDQLQKFTELRDLHLKEIKEISAEIEKTRQFQLETIRQDDTDTEVLDSLNKRMGKLHYSWSVSSGDFLLKVKSICTEEQREKMFSMLERSRKHQLCGHNKYSGKSKIRRSSFKKDASDCLRENH